jgi:hypothetical protein
MTCNDRDTVSPTDDILAIVVDVRKPSNSSGAVYIHERTTGEYLDMVGLEYEGYNVIVPWQSGLELISYGVCRIGMVRQALPDSQVPERNL